MDQADHEMHVNRQVVMFNTAWGTLNRGGGGGNNIYARYALEG